jgi:hypothetical protein
MDWHKLQQTLFALDPTDPREDLAKLQAQAGGRGTDVAPAKDYVAESVDVPAGSMPLNLDSIADFARLAGVRLDEKQKHGDYARGSDPMPKAKPGRTKHPLKDKLVGEEDIEEGPMDGFARGFQAGQPGGALGPDAAERTVGKVTNKLTNPSGKPNTNKPQAQKVKGSVTGAQLGKQLGVSDPNTFNQAVQRVKQGQPLNRMHQAAMSEAFVKLMAMDPQSTQRVMQLLKRSEAQVESQDSKNRNSTNKTESIKDMLYAKLAEKK